MAILFNDATPDYLVVSAVPQPNIPFTTCGWFYADADPGLMTVVGGVDDTINNEYYDLSLKGDSGDRKIRARIINGSALDLWTTTTYSLNTWHHGCGIYNAANSAVFLDGGGKTSGALRPYPSSDINTTNIGMMRDTTPAYAMSGNIAEVAIWTVSLTDAEVAILAAGYSPLFVRPQSLVFYMPLVRDVQDDLIGGLQMTTAGSPTASAHPRIIYPTRPFLSFPAAAPPGGVAPTGAFYGPLMGSLGGPI